MGRKPIPPADPNNLTLQDRMRIASREWKNRNQERSREKSREFRKKNPEYFKQKKKEESEKRRTDPEFRDNANKVRKEYYKKNREKVIGWQKEYADRNVEKLKEYRKKNSEHRTEMSRLWRKANPERHKAARKAWESRNRHVIRMHIALRRAREISATIGDPREIAAWERDWKSKPTNVCEWCQCETPTEFCQSDHAEPLTNGGSHHLSNLVIACKWCNFRKRNKPLSVWLDYLEKATEEDLKERSDTHPNFPRSIPTPQIPPEP